MYWNSKFQSPTKLEFHEMCARSSTLNYVCSRTNSIRMISDEILVQIWLKFISSTTTANKTHPHSDLSDPHNLISVFVFQGLIQVYLKASLKRQDALWNLRKTVVEHNWNWQLRIAQISWSTIWCHQRLAVWDIVLVIAFLVRKDWPLRADLHLANVSNLVNKQLKK